MSRSPSTNPLWLVVSTDKNLRLPPFKKIHAKGMGDHHRKYGLTNNKHPGVIKHGNGKSAIYDHLWKNFSLKAL
jgi:hypothetical protein